MASLANTSQMPSSGFSRAIALGGNPRAQHRVGDADRQHATGGHGVGDRDGGLVADRRLPEAEAGQGGHRPGP
jgi:hypothetical protein